MMGMRIGVFSETVFEANHPFLFIAKEVKNGLTFFIGQF
jgi:serine protease inhibitor